MSKHTAGPWSIPHFATDCACNCAYVVSENQHGMGAIATVHHSEEADGEHNEPMDVAIANARLIAAAPDMLEALRGILPGKLCGEGWNLPDDELVQIMVTFADLRAARAAIAAATGEV